MALSDERIVELRHEACKIAPLHRSAATPFARAVESEVRGQDEALIRQLLEALECSGEPDNPGHRCSHCDDYVDRNSVLRNAARKRLDGAA